MREHVVGASLEGGHLTVVQSQRRNGRWCVGKGFSLDLREGSVLEQARALKERWAREQISAGHIVLTFPHRQAIVKILTLPARQDGEIREMLGLQAARLTPLGTEEIIFDYQLLERTAEGGSRVAMIVVRKEDVAGHLAVFKAAGLHPGRLVLDSFALLPLIKGSTGGEESSLVIEFRGQAAILGLFKGNTLCLVRWFPLSFFDIKSAWARTLQDEVQKTLASSSFPIPSSDLSVMLGGDEEQASLGREVLARSFGHSVICVRPSDRLSFLAEDDPAGGAISWPALAASLISSADPVRMNLLSSEERRRGTFINRRRQMAVVFPLLVFFCAIVLGALLERFQTRKAQLADLIRSCAAQAPGARELDGMEQVVKRSQGRMGREGSFLHVMAELNRLVPGRIRLRSIDFEDARALSLEGTCFSLSEAVHLVEILQKSALFSSVEMRSSSVRRVRDQDVVEFSLSCHDKV